MPARIMPARMGFDLRTFDCPKCDHVHEVIGETDAFGVSFAACLLRCVFCGVSFAVCLLRAGGEVPSIGAQHRPLH